MLLQTVVDGVGIAFCADILVQDLLASGKAEAAESAYRTRTRIFKN
jgi:hypothetical protein